ncbi:UNVERIFIED_CONTAM: putative prolyl 4-hydroxylase 3 [Sesamum latifolium]|uniref:procollagen-proline 4-dioxygenase n=1 Tax=Sesamum latifolium TaxID=2727402 RepID=A0AAW2W9I5_9LAMI
MVECEDNWNCQLENIYYTAKDGRGHAVAMRARALAAGCGAAPGRGAVPLVWRVFRFWFFGFLFGNGEVEGQSASREEILFRGFSAVNAVNADDSAVDASRTRHPLSPHWLRRGLLADRQSHQVEAHEITSSKEECEYLINLAKPHMTKSTVVDSKTGKSKDSRVRTSSGMFLRRGRDKVIRDIEKRIADFTFIPVEHGEGLQVLHYEVGQKYEPHYDYFLDEFNTKNGGQRVATVLMYLSDVEEGGETVFPAAKGNYSSLPGWNERLECAKRGLSLKPKMGDALLFWSMHPDATLDPSSLHGSCPVIRGNKWSCTKWMHVGEYSV